MTMRNVPITGKSRNLPTSLTRKLNRRSAYDPEVAFVRASTNALHAANGLRGTITRIYGDDAEAVLGSIRQRLDATGVLEMDTVAGLEAEAEFYNRCAAELGLAEVARDTAIAGAQGIGA